MTRPDIGARQWPVLAIGSLVALALTVPGWIVVDIDQAWELVPDDVPDALLLAVDRGITPHEMFGVGTVLGILCGGAFVCVVGARWTGRRGWLLGAALQLAAAATLGMVVSSMLLVAGLAVDRLVPDDWDRYDPDLVISPWGPLFTAVTAGLAVWSALLEIRRSG